MPVMRNSAPLGAMILLPFVVQPASDAEAAQHNMTQARTGRRR
jgi:hypothetical protein